ncbi:MAG: DEAD/DEAH box helicase [Gemmatimonadota bacterium]
MSLTHFHPAVARWFHERIGTPTAAQAQGWEAIRAGRDTLIAAPTGSGKTLAAFLHSIDELLREGIDHDLPEETRVVYVSPLKALSADIHKNLAEPRREIRELALEMGLSPAQITAAVRSGDTPSSERAAMLKHPPHILVTTPESLYLLLTAERSREMLRTVRTVIVDEIHAMIESRRGAHLAITLERLQHVANQPIQRIGLSATQKPMSIVADWLSGGAGVETAKVGSGEVAVIREEPGAIDSESASMAATPEAIKARSGPAIVNAGHRRELDIALELPGSPLEAVMSGEVWVELYERMTALVNQHRTTLIFVNTRRLAERLARQLAERLGEDAVTAHHGSLAKEKRLDAEERLKTGKLRALVATASLELGIDIGHVDLVCQIASPRRIATFLQRVGRSGHTISGKPKGRLFPLTRDDLVECTALIRSVRKGELDRLILMDKPLDVLAQQVVAESAAEDWDENALFDLFRGAYPYRNLTREEFAEVIEMVSQGYSTRRGRRGALVHHDSVNHRVRGRRGARMTAIMSGGAIPENADYRVVLEPEGLTIGTLNEDFAIESIAGDIFQLGNTSWRILQVASGTVRVEDAKGQPPSIPFWLGEAPARSEELSLAVAELRRELEPRLVDRAAATTWLANEIRGGSAAIQPDTAQSAAEQIVAYFGESLRMLGALPTQETIIAERFFDEAGGMQLVLHSPFGGRMNRAWGLSLRKRFCQSFNFELQAAATDEALLLSLGPQHSFPLEDVFKFLHTDSVERVLVQALLDAPMFGTRWRWNSNISLAVPRNRSGRKVPPPFQRMQAEDLLAAVFPDAAACLENIAGDREVPDHPLARQTINDCLREVMDIDHLQAVLTKMASGEIRVLARDLPEPSPLTHEILNAKPYAFLDDAPLEERRTQAVMTRRSLDPSTAGDLGALDAAAIERVRDEAWPDPRDADEMHDALLVAGYIQDSEAAPRDGGATGQDDRSEDTGWGTLLGTLRRTGRACRVELAGGDDVRWVATERLPEMLAVHPSARVDPERPSLSASPLPRQEAIRELYRGRLEVVGPTTSQKLAESLGVEQAESDIALIMLEQEGVVLRGSFSPADQNSTAPLEWCDRRLLARIHRYTLNRLRSEIAPVSAAEYMNFLFAWQRVTPEQRVRGIEGLANVVTILDGYECPAAAWESDVLAARSDDYSPTQLDTLCLTGRVAWGRLGGDSAKRVSTDASAPAISSPSRPIRSTPVALFLRSSAEQWLELSERVGTTGLTAEEGEHPSLSSNAREVLEALVRRGASFFPDLVQGSKLLASQTELALAELAAAGLVTADSFAGLRALLVPSDKRKPFGNSTRRHRMAAVGVESAGRWSLLHQPHGDIDQEHAMENAARTYLRRYGVVFKRVLTRETLTLPWRKLAMIYRRLEARGEIRGGRFVNGMSGEQFALPEAVGQLRAVRKEGARGQLISISAADPLNLVGIVTPGDRVPALRKNRILFEDGIPLAALEGGTVRPLAEYDSARNHEIERTLVRRRILLRPPDQAAAGG